MKNMALEAEPDVVGRKLTNHSVRKTLVKKLKASNQPRSAIIGVTSHTSERSLVDNEEGDEAEQRQISSIISSPVSQQIHNTRPVLSSLLIQQNHPACQTMSPPLPWLSSDNQLRRWRWCFAARKQLKTLLKEATTSVLSTSFPGFSLFLPRERTLVASGHVAPKIWVLEKNSL